MNDPLPEVVETAKVCGGFQVMYTNELPQLIIPVTFVVPISAKGPQLDTELLSLS